MSMSVPSPRVGLIATDSDGWPTLPQNAVVSTPQGTVTVPIWDTMTPGQIGPYAAREFRHSQIPSRLFVVMPVATAVLPDSRPACLAVCFVPAIGVDQGNATWDAVSTGPTYGPLIAAQWMIEKDTDGAIIVPALDADLGDLAMLCKSVWPAQWRKYLPTDDPGEPGVRPAAPPSGPMIVGNVLAA